MYKELFVALFLGSLSLWVIAPPTWIKHSLQTTYPGYWPPERQDYSHDPDDDHRRYQPHGERYSFSRNYDDHINDDLGLDYENHGQDYSNDPDDHRRHQPHGERYPFSRNCDDHINDDFGLDYENHGQEDMGCSCLLYAKNKVVFSIVDKAQQYPCSRRGLKKCSRYCDNLFQDEGLRASSQQDVCYVVGKEVQAQLYRRDQVCGSSGLYKDGPLVVCAANKDALTW